MDEYTASVFNKLTEKGAGWTILAMLIRVLPAIIAATVGATGAASILEFVSR
ncbi:hypothetical protein [Novosphingobium sp. TCA1]|uniref:hypothetical protein n=1 Tax=Novosphingobium sp. TCA1 TaxID=2682474 RepID=UPI001309D584|nr:hypothetical protein [Novosphingobium sp. TCA1]GFE77725.1 hypothetical protein NTCA1_53740 [Novosphingobium sp. TCA1]